MLKRRPDLRKWLEWFESLPKKDDAADCFLQGIVMFTLMDPIWFLNLLIGAYFLKKKYSQNKSHGMREKTTVAVYDGKALRFASDSESDSHDEQDKQEEKQQACEIIEISDDEVSADLQGIYATLNPTEDDNFC